MGVRCALVVVLLIGLSGFSKLSQCQSAGQSESSSSNSPKHIKKPTVAAPPGIDAGGVTNGLYRNRLLAMSYKLPAGWVLRTTEMNAREDSEAAPVTSSSKEANGHVLLAAFSRPPEAQGDEVNASVLIAAESVSAYPGLKEAVQYFEPLTEVAQSQGFTIDEAPYEIAMGEKVLVRGDFHKDVRSRKIRQSTVAFLSHGYAVSITVIGGTEDEVEELLDGLEFVGK